jgi:hypothetical protein
VSKLKLKPTKQKQKPMHTSDYIEYLENKIQGLEQSQAELFAESVKLRKALEQGKSIVLKLIAQMEQLTAPAYGGNN